jgi:TolB-like protein
VFRLDPSETSDPASRPAGGAAALPPSEKPSIAILPFANLSGDPEQDYLAEGLRLDIQATLVHASGLFLIAPATVARYRGGATPADQAGRELGVRYVLQGAVRRSGGRIRVTAELTDVIARQIVWAERYDRVLEDGFDVQDEIVAEVLKGLDVRLASGERWLLHSSIGSLQALDVFYRALSRFYAGTKDDNAAAREAFEALARLQPDSAVGPAYLCFTHWVDAFRGWTDSKERSLAEAEAWAKKSVSIRGDNGLPHIVLASVHLLNRRHDEALAECYRAVQLRPNCPTANCYLANILHYCGRSDEAIARVQEAIRITPVYPPWYLTVLAAAYRDSGEFEQSIAAAERGLGMSPGDRDLKLVLCSAFSLAGQPQRARPLVREVVAAEPAFSVRSYLESQAYQDAATLQRLAESLRQAGLPE